MEVHTNGRRRFIRLKDFDYASGAAYFLTLCASERRCIFGGIENGESQPNQLGRVIEEEWLHSLQLRHYIDLDAFVVMPNHFHGIVIFFDRVDRDASITLRTGHRLLNASDLRVEASKGARSAPLRRMHHRMSAHSLSSFVAGFKSAVTRRARKEAPRLRQPIWQRNYYEHVIRDERDLGRIRNYVAANPARWADDGYHPSNIGLRGQGARSAPLRGQ